MEGQGLKEGGAYGTRQQQCLPKELIMLWAKELWQHDYTRWLSLKLGISENEWMKNIPMTGEKGT